MLTITEFSCFIWFLLLEMKKKEEKLAKNDEIWGSKRFEIRNFRSSRNDFGGK